MAYTVRGGLCSLKMRFTFALEMFDATPLRETLSAKWVIFGLTHYIRAGKKSPFSRQIYAFCSSQSKLVA